MKKFNLENLLSALFVLGFDQIDITLYTILLQDILANNSKNKLAFLLEIPALPSVAIA